MGDSLEAILEECEAGNMPIPGPILEHLDQRKPWMDFYLSAYSDLATCRGPHNQIPWLAIDRYCERYGFDDDFSLWFIRCIRVIDDEHVQLWKAEQKREQAELEAKARQSARR